LSNCRSYITVPSNSNSPNKKIGHLETDQPNKEASSYSKSQNEQASPGNSSGFLQRFFAFFLLSGLRCFHSVSVHLVGQRNALLFPVFVFWELVSHALRSCAL
jgi:hypothetical protein